MKLNLLSALIVLALFCLLHASLPTSSVEAQSQSNLADAWTWPLSPWQDFVVGDKSNGGIGYSDSTGSKRHGGLDVWHKNGDAKTAGQAVYAMADGVVSYRCNSDKNELDCQGFGKAVLVSHTLPSNRAYDGETRVTSVYGHLDASKPLVKPGTPVKKGETIIGYLAPTGRCGSICTTAHLHFGIRKGHYGDPGFPSGGWGYVPISDTKEFSQWIEPIGFISDREELWRFQPPQTVTINFPWVYNFSTCDLRPIRVRLGNEVLFSSAPGDEKLVRTFGKFLWFGTYTLNVEYYDVPKAPPVKIEWPFAPNRLACSAEAIFPTSTPTATRTSGIAATLTPLPSPTITPKPSVVMEERIVYTGTDKNLWLIDPEGKQNQKIDVQGEAWGRPILSPDGKYIAYTCWSSPQPQVCIVGVDGKGLRRLTDGFDPSWSPDSKKIIFGFEKIKYRTFISFVDISGNNRVVTDIEGSFPIWSPAGDKIAFRGRGLTTSDPSGLYVANLDGSSRKFLTGLMTSSPSWSFDGRAIAFSCTDVKPPTVCIVSVDGILTKIPTSAGYVYGPSLSPNGKSVAFSAGESLFVINTDGTGLRKIASNVEYAVSWGRFVAPQ